MLVTLSAQSSKKALPPNYYAVISPHEPDVELLDFAKRDPRIEQVARAICRLRGVDPDHVGAPYPQGPVWEYYIPQAMQFLAMLDAAQ